MRCAPSPCGAHPPRLTTNEATRRGPQRTARLVPRETEAAMADYYCRAEGNFTTDLEWGIGRHITSAQSPSALLTTWTNAWVSAWTDGTHGLDALYPTTTTISRFSVATLDGLYLQVAKVEGTSSHAGTSSSPRWTRRTGTRTPSMRRKLLAQASPSTRCGRRSRQMGAPSSSSTSATTGPSRQSCPGRST